VTLKSKLSWQKQQLRRRLALPEKLTSIKGIIYQNSAFGAQLSMALELGHSRKIRNMWKVLECGAGEECRRSVGTIV
jgi:hypothetical protein